jgi:hypothetical protein
LIFRRESSDCCAEREEQSRIKETKNAVLVLIREILRIKILKKNNTEQP